MANKTAIDQYADLMAKVVVDVDDDTIDQNGPSPMFSHRNDLAYLQGYRAIEYLNLKLLGTRRLIRRFKSELTDRGLSSFEVSVHVAQFWVYYWTMMVGSTAEIGGMAYRFTLKRLRQSQATLDRIKQQNG